MPITLGRALLALAVEAAVVLVVLVPFDEIVANPSDLKHVVKLLGRSDGLDVVITTRSHRLCVF